MGRPMWSAFALAMLVLAAMPGPVAWTAAQTLAASPAVSPGPAKLSQYSTLNGVWDSSGKDVFAVGEGVPFCTITAVPGPR